MNIVRILKLFFSVILFPAFIFSQSISSEEKFSQIKTLANDQSKCSELYDLGFSIRAEEPLLAYSCAKYLRDISSQLTDTFYLARAYNLLGILHYRNQEFDKAIYYHRNALKWREALKNESEIGASYTNLGNMYSDLENFEMAESYHLKAFSLFQKLKNTKQILNCLCNLGILKQAQGNYVEAQNNLEQALQLAENLNDAESRIICYNNLGYLHQLKQQYDEALSYFFECIKLNEQMDAITSLAMCYYNVATLYKLKSNLSEAIRWYQRAIELADSSGAVRVKKIALNEIADIYYFTGDYKSAYESLRQKDTLTDLTFEKEDEPNLIFPENEISDKKNNQILVSLPYLLIVTLFTVLLIFFVVWKLKKNKQDE